MCIHHTLIDSVCIRECPTRWCCSIKHFSPPPVSLHDIERIEKTGAVDFFEKTALGFHLKTRPNGYCVFFDGRNKLCSIYPARPPDCRIFPFDYFAADSERGEWVMWDCPYSRRLDEEQIALSLRHFETDTDHVRHILDSWHFGNESYTAATPSKEAPGFRRLRAMRILGPGPLSRPTGD